MRTFYNPSHLRCCVVPLRKPSHLLPKIPECPAAGFKTEIPSLDGMLENLKLCLQISIGIRLVRRHYVIQPSLNNHYTISATNPFWERQVRRKHELGDHYMSSILSLGLNVLQVLLCCIPSWNIHHSTLTLLISEVLPNLVDLGTNFLFSPAKNNSLKKIGERVDTGFCSHVSSQDNTVFLHCSCMFCLEDNNEFLETYQLSNPTELLLM